MATDPTTLLSTDPTTLLSTDPTTPLSTDPTIPLSTDPTTPDGAPVAPVPAPEVTATPVAADVSQPATVAAPVAPAVDLIDQIGALADRVTALETELASENHVQAPDATIGTKIDLLLKTIFGSSEG